MKLVMLEVLNWLVDFNDVVSLLEKMKKIIDFQGFTEIAPHAFFFFNNSSRF